jgi:hypothetical protein
MSECTCRAEDPSSHRIIHGPCHSVSAAELADARGERDAYMKSYADACAERDALRERLRERRRGEVSSSSPRGTL